MIELFMRRRSAAAVLVVALVAAGCGVGGEGTSAFVSGPVEGFGSVIVAGQRFDDRTARVRLEIDPRAPQARTLADLKLNVQVQLHADAQNRLQEAVIAPEVVGPVVRVDLAKRRLVVASQTVQLDAVAADPTLLEGARTLADLAPGQNVIVHGRRDPTGVVRATRIVRLTAAMGVRVMGRLQQFTANGAVIDGLPVDLRGATLLGATMPHAGDRVVVYGESLGTDGGLPVRAWRAEAPGGQDVVQAALAGIVTQRSSPTRWQMQGVTVDASGLDAADLAAVSEGRLARVSGPLEQGILRARSLTLQSDDQAPSVFIEGAVSEFVDARRFSLRGNPVEADAARFVGMTAANLANGVPVQLNATIAGNRVSATTVRATSPEAGAVFVQAGALTQWDPASRRFRLYGLAPDFRLSNTVTLIGGNLADLVAEVVVEVRGGQVGNEFTVQTLTFAAADTVIEVAGVAATVEVTGSTGFLQVNEVGIVWDANTVFLGASGTAADLAEGGIVRIRARRSAVDPTLLRAVQIDARRTQPGVFRLRGTVSDYVSLGDFRIDGQRVDGRAAKFVPASLANALAGAYVDVEGTLSDGVLDASLVSDP